MKSGISPRRFLARRRFLSLLSAASAAPLVARASLAASPALSSPNPPIAPIVPRQFMRFGTVHSDNYAWMRDPDDPRTLAYVAAENAYAAARLSTIRPLADALAEEMKARVAQEDIGVPALVNGYIYRRYFAPSTQFPVILRSKNVPGASEEIVLDVAGLAAENFNQYHFGSWTVSPDNTRVAFSVDYNGGLRFTIFVRDLVTGQIVKLPISDADADLVFAADSRTLLYVRNDPKTLRSYQVRRHCIGKNSEDFLVYEEPDPAFSVSVTLSKSRKFILLETESERTSEVRYIVSDDPSGEPGVIQPRRDGLRYEVDHVGDQFYVRTNFEAPDFRLMLAPESLPAIEHWKEIVPERPRRFLKHFQAFENFVAVEAEDDIGTQLRVLVPPDWRELNLPRPGGIGVASMQFDDYAANAEPGSTVLRFHFSSPIQSRSIYDFDITTGTLVLRQRNIAYPWFSSDRYGCESVNAHASDGERIPITLVYRKDLRRPHGNPVLIVGYGAYGSSFLPTFTASIFSLIDRGFVYAIAHVRGGRENGERWYAEGRLLEKRNTFTDFIAATEALVAMGYADPDAIFAQGASAGGLLMGAVANIRPDLYAGIVAQVPFVDVVATMSDPSVPLTTLEYEEWGNPSVQRDYDYMRSYSPYDNVARKNYPALFVTAGLYDNQVSYVEPARWVAKLRALKTDNNDLFFRTDMTEGHDGRPGRLGSIEQDAEIAAWLIAHAARRA